MSSNKVTNAFILETMSDLTSIAANVIDALQHSSSMVALQQLSSNCNSLLGNGVSI